MRQTFQLNAGELDSSFVKSVRALYGKKKIKIVIEELEEVPPQPDQKKKIKIVIEELEEVPPQPDQVEMFRKSEEVRLRLKSVKVDPNLDLSAMANEMNL